MRWRRASSTHPGAGYALRQHAPVWCFLFCLCAFGSLIGWRLPPPAQRRCCTCGAGVLRNVPLFFPPGAPLSSLLFWSGAALSRSPFAGWCSVPLSLFGWWYFHLCLVGWWRCFPHPSSSRPLFGGGDISHSSFWCCRFLSLLLGGAAFPSSFFGVVLLSPPFLGGGAFCQFDVGDQSKLHQFHKIGTPPLVGWCCFLPFSLPPPLGWW